MTSITPGLLRFQNAKVRQIKAATCFGSVKVKELVMLDHSQNMIHYQTWRAVNILCNEVTAENNISKQSVQMSTFLI